MEKIIITKSVYRVIEEETKRRDTETGGILIGTLNYPIVVEATTPGKNAKLSGCRIKSDTEWDNFLLKATIRKYKGKVKLNGFWHKHPGNMCHPSTVDLCQAQTLIKDIADSGDKKPLYFIISNLVNYEVKIYGYSLSHHQSQFKPVKIEIVDDNAEEVKNAIRNEPMIVQTKHTDFWSDIDFQFYLTKRGQLRIKQEIRELEAVGYIVRALKRQTDNRLVLDVEKDNLAFLVVPPIEYPLGMPKIFNKRTGKELSQTQALSCWNSDCTIKEVLDKILKKHRQDDLKPVKELATREVQDESDLFKTLLRGTLNYIQFVQKRISEYLWHSKKERKPNKHFTFWK